MGRQKILVCGATGFIGRNMAEYFAQREDLDVVGVYNRRPPFQLPNLSWVQADLTQVADVARVMDGIDIVIQAAATTSGSKDIVTRPHVHVTDNAVMNSLIFRAAHDTGVKHLIFFSCTVMLQSSDAPQSETDFDVSAEFHPNYFGSGWTKLYLEKMCAFFARVGHTKYTAIRHSNIYGPYDKFDLERSHVFGATITKVLSSEDGKIVVWGTGQEKRDFLYVDDLADFVAKAIERQTEPFCLYNCGAGVAVSVRELVERVVGASGEDIEIEYDISKPTTQTSVSLNCAKAMADFGWEPRTALDDGIQKTVAWWRANFGNRKA